MVETNFLLIFVRFNDLGCTITHEIVHFENSDRTFPLFTLSLESERFFSVSHPSYFAATCLQWREWKKSFGVFLLYCNQYCMWSGVKYQLVIWEVFHYWQLTWGGKGFVRLHSQVTGWYWPDDLHTHQIQVLLLQSPCHVYYFCVTTHLSFINSRRVPF